MAKLNESQLHALLKARTPIAGISDGGGLTFTLSAGGTASWVLRYRFAGRQRELTLGNYPDIGLGAARKAAGAARARVDAQVDVAGEKRRARVQRAKAETFPELVADYLRRTGASLSERSQGEFRRYLKKDLEPRLRGLAARDIGPEHIIELVETIAKRSDSVARHAFEILNVVFAHGIAKRLIVSNPCAGLRLSAILGDPKLRRRRLNLSLDELAQVLAALPALGKPNELAFQVLLATCVRKGELIRGRWEHVDFERATWTIPDEHSKSGRGFVVPLAPSVVEWFRELQHFALGSSYILPSRIRAGTVRNQPINDRTLNAALDRLRCGVREFSPHDLRSTARSHLAALGVSIVVAERCLNHTLGGLVAVYDQHDYFDERRRALELWAQRIEEVEGRSANVVQLRAAA